MEKRVYTFRKGILFVCQVNVRMMLTFYFNHFCSDGDYDCIIPLTKEGTIHQDEMLKS